VNLTPDQQLDRIRSLLIIQRSAPEALTTLAPLADAIRALDAHLSAGGIPPEAWREGPDAPADSDDWIIASEDDTVLDRFSSEEAAQTALDAGGYGVHASVMHYPDPFHTA
jgi:hypothetical protein